MSSISKQKEKIQTGLVKYQGELEKVIPNGNTVQALERMVMTTLANNPALFRCTEKSIYGAVFTCLQMGLMPNSVTNEAHFVPFKNTCVLIPGYKGLEKLCINSGKVEYMVSRVVKENDEFDFKYTDKGEKMHHVPAKEDRGETVGAYDIAKMSNGDTSIHFMWINEINKHRDRSPSYRAKPGASVWTTDPDKMAMKTVKREHAKQLPMSREVQMAVHLDEMAEAGRDQQLESNIPDCRTLDPDDYEVEGGGKSKDFAFFREIDGLLRLLRVEVGKQGMEEYYRVCLKSLGAEHRDEIHSDEDKDKLKDMLTGKIIEEKLLTVCETEPVTVEGLNKMRDTFREFGVEFDDVIDNDEAYLEAVQNRAYKTAAWRVHELWTGGGDE